MGSSDLARSYIYKALKRYDGEDLLSLDADLVARIKHYLEVASNRLRLRKASSPCEESSAPELTMTELSRYLAGLGPVDALDDETLWIGVACDLDYCLNDFGREYLEVLLERDPANVKWMIAAARWVWSLSGYDPTDRLRNSLGRLATRVSRFAAALSHLASQSQDWRVRNAASRALEVLNSGSAGYLHQDP